MTPEEFRTIFKSEMAKLGYLETWGGKTLLQGYKYPPGGGVPELAKHWSVRLYIRGNKVMVEMILSGKRITGPLRWVQTPKYCTGILSTQLKLTIGDPVEAAKQIIEWMADSPEHVHMKERQ